MKICSIISVIILIRSVGIAQVAEYDFFKGTWQMCDNEGYLELLFDSDKIYFNTTYSSLGSQFSIEYSDSLYYYQPQKDGIKKIPVPYQIVDNDTVIFFSDSLNYFDNTVAVRVKSEFQRPIIYGKAELDAQENAITDYENAFSIRQNAFECLDYSKYEYESSFGTLLKGHWYFPSKDSYEEMIFKKKGVIIITLELGLKEYNLVKNADRQMLIFIDESDTVTFKNVIFTGKDELIMRSLDGFRLKMIRHVSPNSLDTSFKGYMNRRHAYLDKRENK